MENLETRCLLAADLAGLRINEIAAVNQASAETRVRNDSNDPVGPTETGIAMAILRRKTLSWPSKAVDTWRNQLAFDLSAAKKQHPA